MPKSEFCATAIIYSHGHNATQWTDTATTWYVSVDDAYQRLITRLGQRLRSSGSEAAFSDSEVITVALTIETYFHGNGEVGYAFVSRYLRNSFPQLLDLDRFNARRRDLIAVIEALRCDLRDQKLDRCDPVRLTDSAPIALMTICFSRAVSLRSANTPR